MQNNSIRQKVLLSLIGVGDYKIAHYRFGDQVATPGKYVARAISEILKPDSVFIVMTEEAEKKHAEELAQQVTFNKILIPGGKNESELWQIFQKIVDAIPENASLVIDVTHGLRSQPMLLLSIAVYLQVTRGVIIENILYGAFEVTDTDGFSPLFDLSAFLDLINWSVATSHFMRSGDASLLSTMIIPVHNEAYRLQKEYLPHSLSGVGRSLENITAAFSVVRPEEITKQAESLVRKIPGCFQDVENMDSVKPFKVLLEMMKDKYASIAGGSNDLFSEEGLNAQAGMIDLYMKNKQYQQAITLARELIVTKVCILHQLHCIEGRQEAERILNMTFTNNLPEDVESFADIWRTLVNLRNDINHAGMRKSPIPASSLTAQIKDICTRVSHLISALPIQ